jgi:hypothetical protein
MRYVKKTVFCILHMFCIQVMILCLHILQDTKKDVIVIVNVTYSYSIVETAAKDVQAREVWLCNEEIKNMKFTNKWVKSFLLRGGVTRRKKTREDEVVPSDEEIAVVLSIGQKKFIENEHTVRHSICLRFLLCCFARTSPTACTVQWLSHRPLHCRTA